MAATGEPYSVAARNLDATGSSGGTQDAVRDVIACATRTLTAARARIEIRRDTDLARLRDQEREGRRRSGLIGRLARRAARAALERVAPGTDVAELRDMLLHQVGEGFVEPAADRYLIDYGGYAQVLIDGRRFHGLSGQPLGPRYQQHRQQRRDDPLDLLRQLQAVTNARYAGEETVRGTPCRVVAAAAGPAELTVWVDDEHIRRIQTVERAPGPSASASGASGISGTSGISGISGISGTSGTSGTSRTETLELWDFGVPVDSLDWSRLPSFRTDG
jgi:hypothetical protein